MRDRRGLNAYPSTDDGRHDSLEGVVGVGAHLVISAVLDGVGSEHSGDAGKAQRHRLRDRRFHELINTASGNSRLTEYVDSLRDLILTRGVAPEVGECD